MMGDGSPSSFALCLLYLNSGCLACGTIEPSHWQGGCVLSEDEMA